MQPKEVAGAALRDWTPEQSVAVMNANDVETAILSLPGGILRRDRREFARSCNKFSAKSTVGLSLKFSGLTIARMHTQLPICLAEGRGERWTSMIGWCVGPRIICMTHMSTVQRRWSKPQRTVDRQRKRLESRSLPWTRPRMAILWHTFETICETSEIIK